MLTLEWRLMCVVVQGVGDLVVRGPAWEWGTEDGEPGSVGRVTAVKPWKGKENTALQVLWLEGGFEETYRYDPQGARDVQRLTQWGADTPPDVGPRFPRLCGPSIKVKLIPPAPSAEGAVAPPPPPPPDSSWTGALRMAGDWTMVGRPESLDLRGDFTISCFIRLAPHVDDSQIVVGRMMFERCSDLEDIDIRRVPHQYLLQARPSAGEVVFSM
jgi:hypothetical protein